MKQKNFLMVAIALSVLFSCSKRESSLAESENGPVNVAGTTPINYTTKVTINNSGFSPAEVTVMVSGSILWVNGDNMVHTVTAENGISIAVICSRALHLVSPLTQSARIIIAVNIW